MRRRIAASGSAAVAPRRCSRARGPRCVVAGIAQVTAGCDDDELQQRTAPSSRSRSRRPRRAAGGARRARISVALAERAVDDDRDAALARERQDPLLDLAVERVVGDLHEVERLAAHDLLDLAMAAAFRRRDADVAQPARAPSSRRASADAPARRAGCGPAAGRTAAMLPVPARLLDLRGPARARARSRPCRRRRARAACPSLRRP